MELLGNNPSMQDLIEKLNEVVGSLNNSLPNTDSEIAEVKKLVSFGSGVLAGRLNAKLWYFKTQELMTASTELCEGDSCFVLKDGVTTGKGTFEYWYIYKTTDVADIADSYIDLSNPDLVAVKLQDMTLKDVKDTLSAQISDQSKDLNTKISNLRTDTETALSGKADLVNGLIPASQLPFYVDDIVESWLEDVEFPENAYAKEDTEMTTPLTPEFSKIYVNLLNNKTYRWGGNFYVEVSKSLAIGETSTTAFAGDRGKNLEKRIKYLENYVTPEMFGAIGDGVADDTDAVQNALNTGNVYLSKIYKITNTLLCKSNSVIIGNGTIIAELPAPETSDYTVRMALKVSECENVIIDGVNIQSNYMGIFFIACKNFRVSNCKFTTTKFSLTISGKYINNNNIYSENFVLENLIFANEPTVINSDGIHFDGGVRNGICKNILGSTGDDFIAFNVVEGYCTGDREIYNIECVNCESIYNNTLSSIGLRIYGWKSGDNYNRIHHIKFVNCNFSIDSSHQIPAARILTSGGFNHETNGKQLYVNEIIFENCVFYREGTDDGGLVAVVDTVGENIIFNNCTFKRDENCTYYAIRNCYSECDISFDKCNFLHTRVYEGDIWEEYRSELSKITLSIINSKIFVENTIQPLIWSCNTNENSNYDITLRNLEIESPLLDGRNKLLGITEGSLNTLKLRASNLNNVTISVVTSNIIDVLLDKCDDSLFQTSYNTCTGIVEFINSRRKSGTHTNVNFDINNQSTLRTIGDSCYCYSVPQSPKENDFFYKNNLNCYIRYDGTHWVKMSEEILSL